MSGTYSAVGYSQHDKENVDPCAPLLKKSRTIDMAAKTLKTRSRPLPLRKRPLMEEDDTGTTSPLVERKALIRHNMPEDGAKIICRCNKSKCLKWDWCLQNSYVFPCVIFHAQWFFCCCQFHLILWKVVLWLLQERQGENTSSIFRERSIQSLYYRLTFSSALLSLSFFVVGLHQRVLLRWVQKHYQQ